MLRKFVFVVDGRTVYTTYARDTDGGALMRRWARVLGSQPSVVESTEFPSLLHGDTHVDGVFYRSGAAIPREVNANALRRYALVVGENVGAVLTLERDDMDPLDYEVAVDGLSRSPAVVEMFDESGSYYASADYGGCLVGSTVVATPDGGKAAQDLQVGDVVYSAMIDELSAYETPYTIGTWSSDTLSNTRVTTTRIKSVRLTRVSNVYVELNDTDRYSVEQLVLVKRGEVYRFITAEALQVGDLVLSIDGENVGKTKLTAVEKVLITSEFTVVYLFATEQREVMFTNLALVCNMKL